MDRTDINGSLTAPTQHCQNEKEWNERDLFTETGEVENLAFMGGSSFSVGDNFK